MNWLGKGSTLKGKLQFIVMVICVALLVMLVNWSRADDTFTHESKVSPHHILSGECAPLVEQGEFVYDGIFRIPTGQTGVYIIKMVQVGICVTDGVEYQIWFVHGDTENERILIQYGYYEDGMPYVYTINTFKQVYEQTFPPKEEVKEAPKMGV